MTIEEVEEREDMDCVIGDAGSVWRVKCGGDGAIPVQFLVQSETEVDARILAVKWLHEVWFRDERKAWVDTIRKVA